MTRYTRHSSIYFSIKFCVALILVNGFGYLIAIKEHSWGTLYMVMASPIYNLAFIFSGMISLFIRKRKNKKSDHLLVWMMVLLLPFAAMCLSLFFMFKLSGSDY